MPELEQTSPMSRLAYLTYEDMLQKIQTKELDEYDIIYSKDRLITYLISENLEPIEIRSRVYIFNSIEEAETKLNESTDTYIGQIVSILYENTYRGYIVNQKNDKYIVIPLWENPEPIDYNTLGNQPIINLVGTLDEPIIVNELESGIYKISGRYKITQTDLTVYLNPNVNIFIIDKTNGIISIKKISNEEIIDYTVENDIVSKTNLTITEDYLFENGYVTSTYVDKKIEVLNISLREDIQKYIDEVIGDKFNSIIDERIDKKIISATDEDIRSLFV